MKRLTLLFMLLASPAFAVERYVSTSGSATYADASNPATPMSLTTANAGATAGDVLRLRAGNYGSLDINPAAGGSSGSQLIFRPDTIGNPVNVDQISFGLGFISVWGVNAAGISIGVAPGHDTTSYYQEDTLRGVTVRNTTTARMALNNLENSVIQSCVFGDSGITGTYDLLQTDDWNNVTFTDNAVYLETDGSSGTARMWSPNNLSSGDCMWRDSRVWFNRFYMVHGENAVNSGCLIINTGGASFRGNRWIVFNRGAASAEFSLAIRASTTGLSDFTSFNCDTFDDVGPLGSEMIRTSGNPPVNDVSLDSCVIRGRKSMAWADPALAWAGQNNERWSFTNCQMAFNNRGQTHGSTFRALTVGRGGAALVNFTFRHNTILLYQDVGAANSSEESHIFNNEAETGGWTFTDNAVARMHLLPSVGCRAQAIYRWPTSNTNWTRNALYLYNLVGGGDPDSNVAQSRDGGGACSPASANAGAWFGPNAAFGFADTTFNPLQNKPDLRPLPNSRIINSAWPDGYVGAIGPASAVAPPAVDSFYALPQYPSQAGRIPVVLTWFRPATGSSDSAVFIRMYNKSVAQLNPASQTEAAWWDSARVIGEYPFRYREFAGVDGWIVTSPDDSIGFHNSREIAGEDNSYTTASGVVDGAVNTATDLWFGIRYQVGSGPLSPTRYAYMDPDSSLRIFTAASPPAGAVNVGQNVGGTVVWWYKPANVTSYQIRVAPGVLSESGWATATVVPMNLPQNDSVHPPGTIHYARVQPPGCSFFTAAAKYVNPYFTGNVSNLSAISGPVNVTCGN